MIRSNKWRLLMNKKRIFLFIFCLSSYIHSSSNDMIAYNQMYTELHELAQERCYNRIRKSKNARKNPDCPLPDAPDFDILNILPPAKLPSFNPSLTEIHNFYTRAGQRLHTLRQQQSIYDQALAEARQNPDMLLPLEIDTQLISILSRYLPDQYK